MKKRTIAGIGAGLVAGAIAAVSCHSMLDDVETVYGPPPGYSTSDPADEIEDVYGPPVDYDESWDTGEETYEESEEESISEMETVYGPPADYGSTEPTKEWR